VLHNFNREEFLSTFWQKKPLLLKNARPDFENPLPAEELAGLALEDAVESRIVEYRDSNWKLHHGPFSERDFQRRGAWTLLVQAVDHFVPQVAALRQLIDFIPSWRVDDVMVSYAVPGGSVGPHYDNYDVFLLQGQGRREWQLGEPCGGDEQILAHDELRILADMPVRETYCLQPGDILYVPPRLAHWGVALDECMTYSIGFRAPRLNDALSRWVDSVLEHMDPELLYTDPTLKTSSRPGEIDASAINRAMELLRDTVLRENGNLSWFGELATDTGDSIESEEMVFLPDNPVVLQLLPQGKLAWSAASGQFLVFANGETIPGRDSNRELVETLCRDWRIEGAALTHFLRSTDNRELLQQLLETGCVYVE